MNNLHSEELRLLEIIEMAYAAPDDEEMARTVFMALRDLLPFPSGILMPVAADTLQLQPGLCFDCDPADMCTYLTHYAPQDPFVLRQPSPVLRNQSVRFSDVVSASELGRSEFTEFMQRVPYYHALGILTAVAGQPVAVFSVHRQRHERDFNAEEQAIVDRIGPHLARAIVLRRLANDPEQRLETGIVVFGRERNALYLNTTARRFLGTTPPDAVLRALPPQGTGIVSTASRNYRVHRVPWAAASLLHRFAVEEAAADSLDRGQAGDAVEFWSAATRGGFGGERAIILALQPFRQRVDLVQRLARHGLSPRQSAVAGGVLRGLGNGEISRQLYIAEQTVKDHLHEIYHRLGVHTRTELLIKVLGPTSSVPTGRGKRRT